MTFLKLSRSFAFLTVLVYAASTAAYADVLTGKIVSIKALSNGQSEVVLSKGSERETVVLDSKTSVESQIAADKLKAGSTIFLSARTHGGGVVGRGGYKGMKSPFRGIPKGMQKSMGLPAMPETPDVPGQPKDAANVPDIPKVPKVPKAPKQKEGEGAAANPEEGGKQQKRPVQPPVQEPTEEEKSLYGKVSADKPLLKSTGEETGPEPVVAKKVLSVKPVKLGVKVELEGPDGSKEQVTFSPNSHVSQPFSSTGLRKNMQVMVETVKTKNAKVAQRITVVS